MNCICATDKDGKVTTTCAAHAEFVNRAFKTHEAMITKISRELAFVSVEARDHKLSFEDQMKTSLMLEEQRDKAMLRISALEGAIEDLYSLDASWKCQRYVDCNAAPRRNCRNTGSDPCEVCFIFSILDAKDTELQPACGIREHKGLEKVISKMGMGKALMPDPELGQDVAFLAFVITDMQSKLLLVHQAVDAIQCTHGPSHSCLACDIKGLLKPPPEIQKILDEGVQRA